MLFEGAIMGNLHGTCARRDRCAGYHYGWIRTRPPPLKFIARLLLLSVGFAVAAGFGLHWWAHHPVDTRSSAAREVTIAPGSSVRAIGTQLEAAGVSVDPLLLGLLARFERRAAHLQAGTYAIPSGITPERLLDKMESGDVVRIQLVVPEGWTFAQMRALIASQPDIKPVARAMSDTELLAALGVNYASPEGLFFPDTYVYTRGTTDLDIFKRAYRAQQKRLEDAWAARAPDLPFATPYEALTLASIVEKETGRVEDRPRIAAVFINRIRRGMLLQTDPTVIYGMGARFDGNLRRADLVTDTPYNTYTRPGLPPTPIALVGAGALSAVLNPPKSEELYFVARGDGSSEFSGKLSDHNRAVDRFQRGGAQRPSRAP